MLKRSHDSQRSHRSQPFDACGFRISLTMDSLHSIGVGIYKTLVMNHHILLKIVYSLHLNPYVLSITEFKLCPYYPKQTINPSVLHFMLNVKS